MKRSLYVYLFFASIAQVGFTQSVSTSTDRKGTLLNNTGFPDTLRSSAILELRSTNKAFYPPRMPTDSLSKIPSPQAGAIIYDTDKKSIRIYNGSKWEVPSLPKSTIILSESYPNDTLASMGYQYIESLNIEQAFATSYLREIRTIPFEDAPYYNGNGSTGYYGVWGQNRLFITRPDGSIYYYDINSDTWNIIPNSPTLNSGASVVYRGTLKDKYILVASDNTVYTYSISTNLWNTFTNPITGDVSITQVRNTLVFWKKGTATINVFTGHRWYSVNNSTILPVSATTLGYEGNLVFLWNENGVINGKRISVQEVGSNTAFQSTFSQFNAPGSRDNYAYKVIGTKLVSWGGKNGSNFTSTGSIYDFSLNSWSTINANGAPAEMMNIGIDDYNGTIVIYGSIHLGAGYQKAGGGIYNPNSQNWTLINSGSVSGLSPTTFLYKNYLYFWNAFQPNSYFSAYERYNLTSNQWEDNFTAHNRIRIVIWTGEYFIEWGGSFGVNSNVTNNFSSGGRIFGAQGFNNKKLYHLYKKQ